MKAKGILFVGIILLLAACSQSVAPPEMEGLDFDDDERLDTQAIVTYYVSTSGSDGNNGLSATSPFRTIGKAVQVAQPGTMILVRRGTYREQVTLSRSGRSGAPITLRSHPGERAIIDGAGINRDAVRITGSHIVFRNFTVQNSGLRGVLISGSSHVTLRSITSRNNGHVGIMFYNSRDSRLLKCRSYGNYDRATRGNHADGVQALSSQRITISKCSAYNNSDDGFDAWGSTDVVIENSVAYRNGYDQGDGNGFKFSQLSNGRTTVRHSIAYENKVRGFDGNSGSGHVVLNNTSYRNGWGGFVDFYGSGYTVRNNLSFGEQATNFRTGQSHNSWQLGVSNPHFTSTNSSAANFLGLTSSSPAIEKGINVNLPYNGRAPDLGALEHSMRISDLLK